MVPKQNLAGKNFCADGTKQTWHDHIEDGILIDVAACLSPLDITKEAGKTLPSTKEMLIHDLVPNVR